MLIHTLRSHNSKSESDAPCAKEQIQEIGSCGYKPGRIVDDATTGDIPAYVVSDNDAYNYED